MTDRTQSRPDNWDAAQIFLGIIGASALGGFAITFALGIIYIVGETVEHFTP